MLTFGSSRYGPMWNGLRYGARILTVGYMRWMLICAYQASIAPMREENVCDPGGGQHEMALKQSLLSIGLVSGEPNVRFATYSRSQPSSVFKVSR